MNTVSFQLEANRRNEFIDELKRSIKTLRKKSDNGLSLTQYQNLIARSLGYPAFNLLAADIPSCKQETFWRVLDMARLKGLVSEDVEDELDFFDDYWFDASGD
ncbi:hypothetical protein EDF80_105312 [Pseudomonas brenneri]|nr:hypothetical protein EDF80_105312 [Pseudomonas brenneri]